MTGTAAHVTPILEVDTRPVGDGKIGPITKQLQQAYFNIIYGRNPEVHELVHAGAAEAGRNALSRN